jgi:hypothetical protein
MLAWAAQGRAEGVPDDAAAEALFLDGRRLMDLGKIDEACAKFDASEKPSPALGTLMNLADCEEKRGRIATAWAREDQRSRQPERNARRGCPSLITDADGYRVERRVRGWHREARRARGRARGGVAAARRVRAHEREQIRGNQTKAARLLRISRRTLVSRLSEHGLPRPKKD